MGRRAHAPRQGTIFVDANVFLRFCVAPNNEASRQMAERSRRLFTDALEGRHTLTMSEAIIAEVAFILTSRRHYAEERINAAIGIKSVLTLNGCHYGEPATCFRALDLWVSHPEISFPDALAAAHSERYRHQLATFDRDPAAVSSANQCNFPDGEEP